MRTKLLAFFVTCVLLLPKSGRSDASEAGSSFEIRGNGNLCLDVRGGVAANGTPVIVYHCHGGANQSWQSSGSAITGLGGLCLDVEGGQTADRTRVIV
jgi:hypothetical protein